jgi:hypothetical protein
MKKIFFLLEREKSKESELILYIILSVLFLLGPLSGIYSPDKTMQVAEKRYHEDPHGFFTFFVLLPDKNSCGGTPLKINTAFEDKTLSMDTTKSYPVLDNLKRTKP